MILKEIKYTTRGKEPLVVYLLYVKTRAIIRVAHLPIRLNILELRSIFYRHHINNMCV